MKTRSDSDDIHSVPVLAYRVPEVAQRLNLSVRTVHRWIARGEIRAVRIGGSVRVPVAELDRLLGAAGDG